VSYSVRADLVADTLTDFEGSARVHCWSVACHFAIVRIKMKVVSPITVPTHPAHLIFTDLCGKQQTKAVPPKSNRFMADVDAAFVQQIFHISKQKQKQDVHHYSKADDFWTTFEIAKRGAFCHGRTLIVGPAHLKPFSSDSAQSVHKGRLSSRSHVRCRVKPCSGSIRNWQSTRLGRNVALDYTSSLD
jgi:hypothetical protein